MEETKKQSKTAAASCTRQIAAAKRSDLTAVHRVVGGRFLRSREHRGIRFSKSLRDRHLLSISHEFISGNSLVDPETRNTEESMPLAGANILKSNSVSGKTDRSKKAGKGNVRRRCCSAIRYEFWYVQQAARFFEGSIVKVETNPGKSPDESLDVMEEHAAAKYLHVCSKSLRKLRKEKKIPFAKVGRRIIYLRSQLQAWVASGGSSPTEVA